MLAPQSDDEIRPIVAALREMDPLLDVRWNPKARVIEKGRYTVLGKRIDPIYEGLWMVIRYDDPRQGHTGFHPDAGFTRICWVTEPVRKDGVLAMIAYRDGGQYAPVGEWLLEVMRSADARNVETFRKIREKLWAQNDAVELAAEKIDEAMAREGLDHAHFVANYTGGVGNWQGRGADFAAMEAQAGKGKKSLILTP